MESRAPSRGNARGRESVENQVAVALRKPQTQSEEFHPELNERARTALGDRNVILAGFMGTGKSTVGRLLAKALRRRYVDTDHEIERRAGLRVSEIFEQRGERAFRDLETEVAREMKSRRRCVISTGGGFMVRPENLKAAREAGEVILLEATPEEIWERVRHAKHRPLLQTEDPRGRIETLLSERAPAYGAIERKIATGGKSPAAVAREILELLAASARL